MRFPDLGQFAYKLGETLAAEALLLGRTTYESFADAWAKQDGPFADQMNAMPKYVVSSTLTNPAWHNVTVLHGAVAELRRAAEGRVRGDLLVAGSRTLVTTLRRHDLVDEYHLMVFPIVLGSGMRLFDDIEVVTELEPVAVRSFGSVALLTTTPHAPRPRPTPVPPHSEAPPLEPSTPREHRPLAPTRTPCAR